MGITAPLKIGYLDGSGIDTLCITDAHDELVVWGRTGLDPSVSGVKSEFEAAQLIHRFNAHDALVSALETAAARFNLMGGVGLVNGVDPKVGYSECMSALLLAKHGAPAPTNEEAA